MANIAPTYSSIPVPGADLNSLYQAVIALKLDMELLLKVTGKKTGTIYPAAAVTFQDLVNLGLLNASFGSSVASIRIALVANTTFYVSATGNDTTGNGTVSAPWATFAKAMSYITTAIDFNGYTVTLRMIGNITGQLKVTPWVGGGGLIFDGGGGTITYVGTNLRFDGTVMVTGAGPFTIQNVTLKGSNTWSNFYMLSATPMSIGAGMVFAGGTNLDTQIFAENGGGLIKLPVNITVGDGTAGSGGGGVAFIMANGGQIFSQTVPITVTFANSVTYGHTLYSQVGYSFLYLGDVSWGNPGNVTARQANAILGGVIYASGPSGSGLIGIPGTANTRDQATGGQYQ